MEAVLRALFSMPESGDRETLSHLVREDADGPGGRTCRRACDGRDPSLLRRESARAFRSAGSRRLTRSSCDAGCSRQGGPSRSPGSDVRLTDAETGEVCRSPKSATMRTMPPRAPRTTARRRPRPAISSRWTLEDRRAPKEIAACPPERIRGLDDLQSRRRLRDGPGDSRLYRRWPTSFRAGDGSDDICSKKNKRTCRCISGHGPCIAIGDSGIGRLRFFRVAWGEEHRPVDPDASLYSLWLGAAHLHRPFVCICRKPRSSWRSCYRATGSACPTRGRSCPSAASPSNRPTNPCFELDGV